MQRFMDFTFVFRQPPQAVAVLRGSETYASIRGTVRFYQTRHGVIVAAQFRGLPTSDTPCQSPVFGFHLHSGGTCSGTAADPFANAQGHYNPAACDHPYHAGDLPPLFGNHGHAFAAFLTDRFSVKEIIGKTVILHGSPDDFTTQPGGNAGERIACGEIRRA